MKYIADSSVWIDHFKKQNTNLQKLLDEMEIISHFAILTELALGHIKNRKEVLGFLNLLPKALEASSEETLKMIESNKLFGIGLGAIDVQILASAKLSDAGIYTRDQAMLRAMKILKIESAE